MEDETLTQWALAARGGDREAAAALVRGSTEPLRRLLRYLADPERVEDLLQETYLRAFAALPKFEARAPARVWLYSIARRVAADEVRNAQRSPRTSGNDVAYELDQRRPHPDPSGLVALQQALRDLAPERRDAFVMTRVLGMSYAEAAEVCGCAVGSIRSRVFRARSDLIEALGSEENLAGEPETGT